MEISNQFLATQLSCIRQQKIIFADIAFELSSGDLLLVEGANGSGKSSLLRLLAGLATPASGEITWRNQPIAANRDQYNASLHYLGHHNGIKLGLSVQENLQLAKSYAQASWSAPLDEVLQELQLLPYQHTPVQQLSAGQRRRVALARLCLFKKPLWILDEPLTALDTNTHTWFIAQLQSHITSGNIAIVSSHHSLPAQLVTQQLRLASC